MDLDVHIRTVTHVAQHFQELKTAAGRLHEVIEPETRGYFTPREEEEIWTLLISYRNTRNALFDVLDELRAAAPEFDAPTERVALLTGFTAALLLVDAAWFLRELTSDRPIVQEKLNEPVPELGIEGGFLHRVQRSLSNPLHVWHFYHAWNFFDQNELEIRAEAWEYGCQKLLEIMDRLRLRLDVSVKRFARARLRTRADQIARGISKDLVGRALYGLQKLGGTLVSDKYVKPGHCPGLPDHVIKTLRPLLEPGDVLVVRKEFALTNYFLPGFWPHVALYLGNQQQLQAVKISAESQHWRKMSAVTKTSRHDACVLESMKDGVHIRDLASPFSSDSIVVVRPTLSGLERGKALQRALTHEGKPYDFDFDFRRADKLVCTEVIFRAFEGVGQMHLPLVRRAGRPTLSARDILSLAVDRQGFSVVAAYAPTWRDQLVFEDRAIEAIQALDGTEENSQDK